MKYFLIFPMSVLLGCYRGCGDQFSKLEIGLFEGNTVKGVFDFPGCDRPIYFIIGIDHSVEAPKTFSGKLVANKNQSLTIDADFDTCKLISSNWLDNNNLNGMILEFPDTLCEGLVVGKSYSITLKSNDYIPDGSSLWLSYVYRE